MDLRCGVFDDVQGKRFATRYLLWEVVFNGLCYIVKTGNQRRIMSHDLLPWPAVYQQMRRWIDARCFETIVEDLRMMLRKYAGRKPHSTAVILDNRTLKSTPSWGAGRLRWGRAAQRLESACSGVSVEDWPSGQDDRG
jgi:transposase